MLVACAADALPETGDLSGQLLEIPAEQHRPACIQRSSQVALFGDSYINWISHTFPEDLNRVARARFRDYAVGGYSMATGGIGSIPSELDTALAEDPDILAAVVDGGGNDILVSDVLQFPQSWDCKNSEDSPNIPDCQKIVRLAVEVAEKTLQRMADVGIRDVVYFFYPHVPEGTLIGGLHPNEILNYALPKAKATCDGTLEMTGGALACHFVDMVPVFEGHPEFFAPTDIHPNPLGSAAMAKAVWAKMKSACMGQRASSGCCEP